MVELLSGDGIQITWEDWWVTARTVFPLVLASPRSSFRMVTARRWRRYSITTSPTARNSESRCVYWPVVMWLEAICLRKKRSSWSTSSEELPRWPILGCSNREKKWWRKWFDVESMEWSASLLPISPRREPRSTWTLHTSMTWSPRVVPTTTERSLPKYFPETTSSLQRRRRKRSCIWRNTLFCILFVLIILVRIYL